ncbi:MAG: hypothetical protein PHW53_03005 [Patescibacteria group bacterium]|nr:hypothetical protein [Patescibacteria group bacterium]
MRTPLIILAVIVVIGLGVYLYMAMGTVVNAPTGEPGAVIQPGLTLEQARAIAVASDCAAEGPITDNSFYNENSKTWWFDMDIEKTGCAPACVVSEETRTAEINWRCTGLIIPE